MANLSPENMKQIKSTAVGGILFLLGLIVFTVEYFSVEDGLSWEHYVAPAVMASVGIIFLFAPDKAVNFIYRKLNRNIPQ